MPSAFNQRRRGLPSRTKRGVKSSLDVLPADASCRTTNAHARSRASSSSPYREKARLSCDRRLVGYPSAKGSVWRQSSQASSRAHHIPPANQLPEVPAPPALCVLQHHLTSFCVPAQPRALLHTQVRLRESNPHRRQHPINQPPCSVCTAPAMAESAEANPIVFFDITLGGTPTCSLTNLYTRLHMPPSKSGRVHVGPPLT